MDHKWGIIYKHTNKLNNKVYIGKTVQKLSRRVRTGKGYKSCFHFNAAIEKYGWSNFETDVLCSALDINYLQELESIFINQYKSDKPEYGYNLVQVDKGLNRFPDSIKQKISNKRKEYYKKLDKPWVPYNKNLHIQKDNIVLKKCTTCKNEKELNEFNKNKRTWDKLMRQCRPCHIKLNNKHRKEYIRLSEIDWKKSYDNRQKKSRN